MSNVTLMPGNPKPPATVKARSDEQIIIDDLGEENAAAALAICDRIASEALSLEEIAGEVRGLEGHVAARAFYKWRVRSSALGRTYARACSSRAHVIANRMMTEINSTTDPHMARVKMDAIKWLSARFNRADFGDEPGAGVGVSITVNADAGATALEEIQRRLDRKREALQISASKSMLIDGGVRVQTSGEGEGG